MLQIVLKRTESLRDAFFSKDLALNLGCVLIDIVEKSLGLVGKKVVAFTSQVIETTINERDVQIEVRYTAGEDEYGQGEPFDPNERHQEIVNRNIYKVFKNFFQNHNLPNLSLSTRCKVYGKSEHRSIYQEWD